MNVIYESRENLSTKRLVGVGLGTFDGIHIGHADLIGTLIRECKNEQLDSVIYTFTGHPEKILRKQGAPSLLTTVTQKISLLERLGVDYLFLTDFSEPFSHMEPEKFVEEKLVKLLGAKLVVVGYNYRFGFMGRGDGNLLKKLGEKFGFRVIVMEPVKIGGRVVSSTYIRKLISSGEVDKASLFLGRPYAMEGKVVSGQQVGQKLGFPTANLETEDGILFPARGVYVTSTLLDGSFYDGVTNVGLNPTVSGKTVSEKNQPFSGITAIPMRVENHLLDVTRNLYGEKILIRFLHRIRGEFRFGSKAELAGQIQKDTQFARSFFMSKRESQG